MYLLIFHKISVSERVSINKECNKKGSTEAEVERMGQLDVSVVEVSDVVPVSTNDGLKKVGVEGSESSGKEVVSKLLEELENMKVGKSPDLCIVQPSEKQVVPKIGSKDGSSWYVALGKNYHKVSPNKQKQEDGSYGSPNGFQALQNIREEREIDEDDEGGSDQESETGKT